jgi:phosphate transport system permease protein
MTTTETPELHDELDDGTRTFDPMAPLTPSGNLRRRKIVSAIVQRAATLAAIIAVAVLVIVVWSVFKNGAEALSIDFLTKDMPQFGGNEGGIGPAIVGTAEIVAIATVIAMPLGILIALFLTEFASPRISSAIRLVLDLINGLPSIVIAVFVFGLLVSGHHGSGFAAAVALGIIELPLIARGSQEVLMLVPNTLREGADALGVSKRRSVLGVILPAALGGILTSTVLAVARAAGETAPVLLVAGGAAAINFDPFNGNQSSLALFVYQQAGDASKYAPARAWTAALTLVALVLALTIAAKLLARRSRLTR